MDVHPLPSYIKRHHPTLYPFVKPLIWFNGLREKKFYNNVSGVSGLARGQLEIAKSRINNKNVPSCLVYNSICVEKFREQMTAECNISLPNKNEGWIWCVYAGSLGPSYDIPTIIDCANKSKSNRKKVLFIIAGSGEYASVCKQNKNDQDVFLEYLDKRDLVPIYSKCDIGLCTYADFSTVDMPDKFYDYTAAGLAIVNSLHGEIEEHVRSSRLGVQYRSGDADDLYEKICLFEDESLLNYCKKNSWKIADEFDFEKQLDLLEGFINRIDEQDNS